MTDNLDADSNEYPKKLYLYIGKCNEGHDDECYFAYEDPANVVDKDNQEKIAVYEFKGIVTVRNDTQVIE